MWDWDSEDKGALGLSSPSCLLRVCETCSKTQPEQTPMCRACEMEDAMDDVRTQRLAKLLSVANRLTALNHDVTNLLRNAETDSGALNLLLIQLQHAEEHAGAIYNRELEARA